MTYKGVGNHTCLDCSGDNFELRYFIGCGEYFLELKLTGLFTISDDTHYFTVTDAWGRLKGRVANGRSNSPTDATASPAITLFRCIPDSRAKEEILWPPVLQRYFDDPSWKRVLEFRTPRSCFNLVGIVAKGNDGRENIRIHVPRYAFEGESSVPEELIEGCLNSEDGLVLQGSVEVHLVSEYIAPVSETSKRRMCF